MHFRKPNLTPEQEVKWNERARLFVYTFQKMMGERLPDSLAGQVTFGQLYMLHKSMPSIIIPTSEWTEIFKSIR